MSFILVKYIDILFKWTLIANNVLVGMWTTFWTWPQAPFPIISNTYDYLFTLKSFGSTIFISPVLSLIIEFGVTWNFSLTNSIPFSLRHKNYRLMDCCFSSGSIIIFSNIGGGESMLSLANDDEMWSFIVFKW